MIKHKLSNIVLKIADHMQNYPDVYYRVDSTAGGSAQYLNNECALEISGKVDFLTYFNVRLLNGKNIQVFKESNYILI